MAEIERSMIRAAREVIVLADHTILDIESNYHVVDLDAVDTLITDAGIPAPKTWNSLNAASKCCWPGVWTRRTDGHAHPVTEIVS